ncbi:GAL4 [Geosmithia morbida]|uniref:GAL4 n=1 Tax=Geosmithia morbida TaxID=1094350 RepID=A0A9P5D0X5_9HYPO|nr:GAL4 [Geosmithia morbida]KAF4119881.1 GAL4 [Geosmithia morbida]
MAYAPEPEPQKRKRDPDDAGTQPTLAPLQSRRQSLPLAQRGASASMKVGKPRASFCAPSMHDQPDKANAGMQSGVLERNDSFAASLGAKLSGPRLLRAVEKSFESPIKISSPSVFSHSVTWLDVCNFAKANPSEFLLTILPDGSRCCQFICKGMQVEISEDDWRFITSGVLDRIPLEHPLEEDETAELATLDILEKRASALWHRADEVSARSRILHHRLGQRRQEIQRRQQTHKDGGASGPRFPPLDQPARPSPQHSSYDIHADLLQQFMAASETPSAWRPASALGISHGQASPSTLATQQPHRASLSGRPSTAVSDADAYSEKSRLLMTQKIDKLMRAEPIVPPCDRCRRLKLECVKYLSACQGCTKKHAKCSWRVMSDDESAELRRQMGVAEAGAGTGPGTETVTPEHRPLEMTASAALGSVASNDTRPPSRSGSAAPESAGFGVLERHAFLPSPIDRVELPPMRLQASMVPGQGFGVGMSRRPS